ncbi:Permease protein of ABC transporter [Thiocapsa sp. KS1]|nr:FtsX-like permease family protein [Thiocapsa sp. KS1]CRI67504.1 Permease protein of ABC transporter [Thiocapsa sp. KS1]
MDHLSLNGCLLGRSVPRSSFGPVAAEVWALAWKDLRHDRHTTLVFVLTVAAILAPLLLLLGLKNGVVETLRETLLRDPRNLEVVIYGSARLDRDWLAAIAARPDVAFLIPKTRTINASVDLLDSARRLLPAVEVIPTALGDPLLPPGTALPSHPGEVLVTATLARRLGLLSAEPALGAPASGAEEGVPTRSDPAALVAVVKRTRDGVSEHMRLPLSVIGIVPEARFARDALFTSLDLLVAAEDYRDGTLDLPPGGVVSIGYADRQTRFANARLYATGLDQVGPLAAAVSAEGIEVRTQAERIASVQAVDRTLSFLFRVIAVIGGAGCALALGGALWVGVERKRRQLALLRLFGFGPGAVAALPVIQGSLIAALGLLFAGAGYLAGAHAFDAVMGENLAGGGYLTRLGIQDLGVASGLVMLVALVASTAGAIRAGRVSPAEGLREAIR